MTISVPESATELKEFLRSRQVDLDKAMEWMRSCYKAILEEIDEDQLQSIGEESRD